MCYLSLRTFLGSAPHTTHNEQPHQLNEAKLRCLQIENYECGYPLFSDLFQLNGKKDVSDKRGSGAANLVGAAKGGSVSTSRE